jgi:hypothetical protein
LESIGVTQRIEFIGVMFYYAAFASRGIVEALLPGMQLIAAMSKSIIRSR